VIRCARSVQLFPSPRHAGLGAAVLFGTAKAGRSDPTPPIERPIVFQPAPVENDGESRSRVPSPWPADFGDISVSTPLPKTGATMPVFSPIYSGAFSTPAAGQPGGGGGLLTEEHAEVLTAPLPLYHRSAASGGSAGKSRARGHGRHDRPSAGAIDLGRLGD